MVFNGLNPRKHSVIKVLVHSYNYERNRVLVFLTRPLYQDYFCYKSNPMNLLMYVGDELVESVPLEKEMISKPGYLGNFKRRLQNKYREVFPNAPKPEFFVANPTTHIRPAEMLIRAIPHH